MPGKNEWRLLPNDVALDCVRCGGRAEEVNTVGCEGTTAEASFSYCGKCAISVRQFRGEEATPVRRVVRIEQPLHKHETRREIHLADDKKPLTDDEVFEATRVNLQRARDEGIRCLVLVMNVEVKHSNAGALLVHGPNYSNLCDCLVAAFNLISFTRTAFDKAGPGPATEIIDHILGDLGYLTDTAMRAEADRKRELEAKGPGKP